MWKEVELENTIVDTCISSCDDLGIVKPSSDKCVELAKLISKKLKMMDNNLYIEINVSSKYSIEEKEDKAFQAFLTIKLNDKTWIVYPDITNIPKELNNCVYQGRIPIFVRCIN